MTTTVTLFFGNIGGQTGAIDGAIGASISNASGDGIGTITGTIQSVTSAAGMIPGPVGGLGNAIAVGVSIVKVGATNTITWGDVLGVIGGVAGMVAATAAAPGVIALAATISLGAGLASLTYTIANLPQNGISPDTNGNFQNARNAVAPIRRDPLILDLDSDGFETVGIDTTAPILFDHDGDGVKTATGWVAGDDAFLVLDRNGNGTIDDGHELFGDATPLVAGGTAADGFAALAQEDSNNDGQVDALDAHFADLRLWRDLNQDGISQSDELLTLASQGIVSLSTARTTNSTLLANGNQIADLGGFVRSDGTSGTLGAVEQLADVNLASDPFYSEFTDTIPLTEQVQALPDMQGSGMVRSLREAASLQTAEGNALGSLLAAFAAATTRSDQMALLDGLLKAWADTSTLSTTADSALAGVNLTLSFAGVTSGSAAWQTWVDKLSILECFNGQTFMPVPAAGTTLSIDFFSTRETLLDAAYTALRDSVYGSLVMQTRLKPYMDEIQLVLTEDAVSFDFSQLNALLAGKRDDDPYAATQDFADLVKFGDATLAEMGWSGTEDLVRWANELSSVIDVNAALREVGLAIASGSYTGTDERDVQFGSSGANSMSAGLGDDVLAGLAVPRK
jgi:trimeric autotransporter adhesin